VKCARLSPPPALAHLAPQRRRAGADKSYMLLRILSAQGGKESEETREKEDAVHEASKQRSDKEKEQEDTRTRQ